MKNSEESLRNLWGIIKQSNIHIIGIEGGREREKDRKNIWKNTSQKLKKFSGIHVSTY